VLDPVERDAVFRHALDHFPALGEDTAEGLDDLPFLDHRRARAWYRPSADGSRCFSSTGTSGHPKRLAWAPEEDAWYVGEKQALFGPWLAGLSRAFVSLAVGHNAGSARQVLEGLGLEVHDAGLSPLDEQCSAIAARQPEVLYCSPSILARLVDRLRDRSGAPREGGRPGSIRRVITNGEVLFPSVRARAQEFFGIGAAHLMDTYGSTEIGTIATTCPACGAYHFLDGLYPEPVPPEVALPSAPADGPDAVVLAVSSVKRTSFPVVRLVTYDVVQGLRRQVCGGVSRFTMDRVLGRCDDLLNYGELFSSFELADLIRRRFPVARWYAFNPRNDLALVIEGVEPPDFRDLLRDRFPLHSRLSDLGLVDEPRIRFVRDFDAFAARAGLAATVEGKEPRHVLTVTPDPSWFDEEVP